MLYNINCIILYPTMVGTSEMCLRKSRRAPMKFSKIAVAVLLILCMAVSLFACGPDTPDDNNGGGGANDGTIDRDTSNSGGDTPTPPAPDEWPEGDTEGDVVYTVIPAAGETEAYAVVSVRSGKLTGRVEIAATYEEDGVTYPVLRIEDNAFRGAKSITELVIPVSVTSIGQNALAGCTGLEKITLPFVGASAADTAGGIAWLFGGVSFTQNASLVPASLRAVVLSDACTAVPAFAFDGCASLSSVTLAANLASIGAYAFGGCALQTVAVPASVESIGIGAFASCPLTAMEVPFVGHDRTAAIGHIGYFFGAETAAGNTMCPATLRSVKILSGCTAIGEGAFADCDGIETLELPATIVSIGRNAFTPAQLAAVSVEEGGFLYIGRVLYSYNPASAPKNVTMRDSTVAIAAGAFDGLAITGIDLPDSVAHIGAGAFRGATMTTLTLPFIGESADSETNATLAYIFGGEVPATLTSVVLNERCTRIASGAFAGAVGLREVTIGASVTEIGTGAFHGCTALTAITVDAGNAAYQSTADGIVYTAAGDEIVAVPAALSGAVTLLPTVTVIPADTFRDCRLITSLVLPDGLSAIGDGAFAGCSLLASFNIPDSLALVGRDAFDGTAWYRAQEDGVVYIGRVLYICKGNRAPTSLIVREGTVSITAGAFAYDLTLEKIDIPASVRYIGAGVFRGVNIRSLILPYIGDSVTDAKPTTAFLGYLFGASTPSVSAAFVPKTLTSLTLRSGCLAIRENALRGCDTLTDITFPASLVYVYGGVLDSTAWYAAQQEIPGVIYAGSVAYSFVAPEQAYEDYSTEERNGRLTPYDVVLRDGTVAIADSAFMGSAIRTVWMPDSVLTIGEYAFAECAVLKTVDISLSLTDLGAYAFSTCTVLDRIYLPGTIGTVKEGTFMDCEGLRIVWVGAGITNLGGAAGAFPGTPPGRLYFTGTSASAWSAIEDRPAVWDSVNVRINTGLPNSGYVAYQKNERPAQNV